MIFRWYRTLLRLAKPAKRQPRRSVARPLGFDWLEDRTVPTFLAPTSYVAGANPAGIAVGDYNADGKADIAVVNQSAAGTVGVLLSVGDGTFQPKIDYAAGAYAVDASAGDFNNDGKLDLAVVGGTSAVNILFGNGDGSFGAPTAYGVGIGAHSINVGDFNHDGQLDVATMNSGTASVLLGNGDGTFQPRLDTFIPGNSTNTVVDDFNRDGNLDLATSNTISVGTVTILKGHGDGSFDPAASYYAFSAPVYVGVGDFNHDGYDDLACPNSYAASSMSVMLNNGDGTYGAPHTYNIAQTGYEIEVEDFNHDGNDDFAVRGGSQYMVHLGKGDGNFYPSVNYAIPAGRFEMGTHGDFNGDGATDFAYPSTSGVTVIMNGADDVANVAGAVGFSVSTPASTTSGSALPMTVSAVDAAGNVVPGFRGTVFITSNDPAVTSSMSYTFTAADAGTHAFAGAVRLVTQGEQSVTVAAPFLTATTSTVTVTPGVSRFVVSAPTASAAGDTFSVTVTAVDALGNIGTGYTSSIRFSSTDGQAGLPGDYTFTPADGGVHTFSVMLKTAGSSWLGVTEVGGVVNGGQAITVTPGAATSFTLAGGAGAIGVVRPVSIIARDDYGNIATSYNGTVHVTSSDPQAILPADAALVNGAGLVNVTLLTVGSQSITATDIVTPTLTGTVLSDATPPIASRFVVSDYPATTAGVAQSFTVTVRDTIGQVASGYTGTIYFSSSDQQAGLPASYTFISSDAGVHTFTATLKTAGTQALTVRDVTGALTGTQMGITVSPAAFAGFRLSIPNPADSRGHVLVTAGDVISLTVRATDAFGNTVVGYKGKVKFSSTDTLASLPTDYAFATADAGVHTFSVALKTTTPNGVVWSFNVVDAANAATLATLTNFEVVNAAAAKFVINVPSNITAGVLFSLKVSVLDAYGNRVKNYFGTIHFSNTAGSAGLPADYTFTGDDAGVHSFDVTLNTTGNQTLALADVANSLLTVNTTVSVKAPSTGGGGGGGGSGGGGGGGGRPR